MPKVGNGGWNLAADAFMEFGLICFESTVESIHSAQYLLPSSYMFQRDPRAGAFLGGDRVSGQDIRDQNGTWTSHLLSPLSSMQFMSSYRCSDHRKHRQKFFGSNGARQDACR